jgi:hypothetical protein
MNRPVVTSELIFLNDRAQWTYQDAPCQSFRYAVPELFYLT